MLSNRIKKITEKYYGNYFLRKWLKQSASYKKARNYSAFPRFLFLPVPILNNKYLANALKKKGYTSDTLMVEFYSINSKTDFDLYFDELKNGFKNGFYYKLAGLFSCKEDYLNYRLFEYCIQRYDIFCMPFTGGVLSYTPLKKFEAQLLKSAGAKIITLPYGADYFQYSRVLDPCYRHAIIASYPEGGRREYVVNENYKYWAEHANCLVGSMATDGMGRWDIIPVNYISIDADKWKHQNAGSDADGVSGSVRITHSPNHRYVKGTEFIIDTVKKLQGEGLKIELTLIEKKSNEEVKQILQTGSDIHIEQLIYTGYALSAIEGMACGLPVITNEENEILTRVLRRYSFLNECPVVSATPENITDVLRALIKNPGLRKELGVAGRKYVEKYHSDHTTQDMFERIVDRIWFGKEIDLMSYYHPLNPDSYNNKSPVVSNPLKENRIPAKFTHE
jgi:hypothetical protein